MKIEKINQNPRQLSAVSCQKFDQRAFTLIELLIYTALTIIVVGLFGAILITVVRVQGTQTGTRQVTQEADFIIGTIKRQIRDSEAVTVGSSTLTITTAASSTDPTVINLSSSTIYIKEGLADRSPLATTRVIVDELTFAEKSSGNSKTVDIHLKLTYNIGNPQQAVSQTIETSQSPLKRID